jgi:hypothetical protein
MLSGNNDGRLTFRYADHNEAAGAVRYACGSNAVRCCLTLTPCLENNGEIKKTFGWL